jgi:hypothetical protein
LRVDDVLLLLLHEEEEEEEEESIHSLTHCSISLPLFQQVQQQQQQQQVDDLDLPNNNNITLPEWPLLQALRGHRTC